MKTGSEKIDSILAKKNKRWVIAIAVVILIGIGIGVWSYLSLSNPSSLQQLNYDGSKQTDQYAYLEIASEPYLFAERESERLYIVLDTNGYLYIVRLSDNTYNKLAATNLEQNPVTVKGSTRIITDEIKRIAVGEFGSEGPVTSLNFEDYFGYVYLDTAAMSVQWIVVFIWGIVFVTMLSIWLSGVFKTKKMIKKYSQSEWEQIGMQLDNPDSLYYKKEKLYLVNDYMVHVAGPEVIKYDDVAWVYRHVITTNGVPAYYVHLYTKDKKQRKIQVRNEDAADEIILFVASKNSEARVGFTLENKQAVKGL